MILLRREILVSGWLFVLTGLDGLNRKGLTAIVDFS